MLTPGVGVLLGFVLVVGNPWLNRDIILALSDVESSIRIADVLVSYPSWHVNDHRVGPFLFWFMNLRTVLFVALAIAGLAKVPRWVSPAAGGVGLFVTTVGMTTLSAVTAGLVSATAAVTLLDSRSVLPFISSDRPEEFLLAQLGSSASFGLMFGLVLGAVAVMHRPSPVSRERRVTAPKSFW
ncbi:hypothetical protein ABZ345_06770 [Lentzea sp. NPDC005914]|uniref:hypothetical protein n=1 Tax=Lentzea sp. NPDC005914 TaxID=3154572 RepID=UPI0034100684